MTQNSPVREAKKKQGNPKREWASSEPHPPLRIIEHAGSLIVRGWILYENEREDKE